MACVVFLIGYWKIYSILLLPERFFFLIIAVSNHICMYVLASV